MTDHENKIHFKKTIQLIAYKAEFIMAPYSLEHYLFYYNLINQDLIGTNLPHDLRPWAQIALLTEADKLQVTFIPKEHIIKR